MIKISKQEFIHNAKNLSKKEMTKVYSVCYTTLRKLYKELEIEKESAKVGRPKFNIISDD